MKMTAKNCSRMWMAIAVAALAGRIVLIYTYPYASGDYIYFLRHWIEHLVKNGYEHGWPDGPWNYNMPYIYLLTGLAHLTTHWLSGIKMMSVAFDVLMAAGAWRVVNAGTPGKENRPHCWMAAAVMLLLPTFFTNSALWGQCDSIYAGLMLLCVSGIMRGRPVRAMLLFGLALAFKLQSVFVIPALLMLTFKRRIPLWTWVLVPAVYLACAMPAIAMGRGFMQSLTPHYSIAVVNGIPAYPWVPNIRHAMHSGFLSPEVLKIVMAVCSLVSIIVATVWARYTDSMRLQGWGIPLAMFVSAAVVPFFLPGMHERYFALAIALGVVLFAARPRQWWLCLAPEVLSIPSYVYYLAALNRFPVMEYNLWINYGISLCYLIFLVWLLRIYLKYNAQPDKKPCDT